MKRETTRATKTRKVNYGPAQNFIKRIREATLQAWVSIILSFVAAGVFIAAIIIPPPGEVHPSVIHGIGLIIVIIAIFFAWDATIRGLGAKFEHGKTKLSVGGTKKRKLQSDTPANEE